MIFLLAFGFLILQCDSKQPSKVYGGTNALPGEIPYVVSISTIKNSHFCGGTIITSRHILTAAHCFASVSQPYSESAIIRTGMTNNRIDGENHRIQNVVIHKDYKVGSQFRWRNDIAVVTVADNIRTTRYQAPIALPRFIPPEKFIGILSGWGYTGTNSEAPDILQKSYIQMISNDECNLRRPTTPVLDTHICGYNSGKSGFCPGDSGGPLVYNNQIVGISSFFTRPCASGTTPDVYTRVDRYINFIHFCVGLASSY